MVPTNSELPLTVLGERTTSDIHTYGSYVFTLITFFLIRPLPVTPPHPMTAYVRTHPKRPSPVPNTQCVSHRSTETLSTVTPSSSSFSSWVTTNSLSLLIIKHHFILPFVLSLLRTPSCAPFRMTMRLILPIFLRPRSPNIRLNGSLPSMRNSNHSNQKGSMKKLTHFLPARRLSSANGCCMSNETKMVPFHGLKHDWLRRVSPKSLGRISPAPLLPLPNGTPFVLYFPLQPLTITSSVNST